MIDKCKQHLDGVHEDYVTHLFFAIKIAALCFFAGVALVVHALVPAFFERTGSTTIFKIQELITERKKRQEIQTANQS